MNVISRVEISKEELNAIKKVSELECSGRCNDCPLDLSNSYLCVKLMARYTLENVPLAEE